MPRPAASRALRGLAYAFRALALAFSALTLLLCVGTAANLGVLSWVQMLNALLPTSVSGLLVIATPLGGAFRGDFFIAALVLFVLDWACMRASSALR